ncbi:MULTISPECIES: hypothetical protein [unclassified Thiocapsa]|uniref:hypothetical protein n=1 Tax=unclassified Thiocapsa TaxID=2641286 RepID=UPI0035B441F7
MKNYFTYLWTNARWKQKCESSNERSRLLSYAASENFRKRGVEPGSTVFIVTVLGGELYLGGSILVSKMMTHAEAKNFLDLPEQDLWRAEDYIVAEKGKEMIMRCDNKIPAAIAHELRFWTSAGSVKPKVVDGELERQTLRGIRQLYPGSEKPLLSRAMA